jgi:hypothetical protein
MISMARTLPVNPEGAEPKLTRDDLWWGLEQKALNALPFVPDMTRCEVKSKSGNVLEREIELRGDVFGERITLNAPDSVVFERTYGPSQGTIRNDILTEDDGSLGLRFSFDLVVDGIEEGSAAERDYQERVRDQYLAAVESTLVAVRERVGASGQPAVTKSSN